MKRFAIIEGGTVANIAKAAGPLADNWIQATEAAEIGGTYDPDTGFGPRPAPPPTPDQVRAEGERRLRVAAGAYTDAERETWMVQVDEARAVLADPAAFAPMLTPLAAARGLTITEMAQRVLSKAQALASASGAILAAQSVLIATDPIPQDYAADHHWPDPAPQQ